MLTFFTRCAILSLGVPGIAIPATSPFTSAMKDGTPIRENPSATTSREMVGLARARRPGDVAVAIAVLREQRDGLLAPADEDLVHPRPPIERADPAHGEMLRPTPPEGRAFQGS